MIFCLFILNYNVDIYDSFLDCECIEQSDVNVDKIVALEINWIFIFQQKAAALFVYPWSILKRLSL